MAKIGIRLPRAVTPSGVVGYAAESKVGGVVLLMAIIVGLDLLRRGWPATPGAFTQQRFLSYFGAAFVFVVLANFAPQLAQALLWAVVVLMGLNLAPQVAAWFRKLNAGLATPRPIPHGLQPAA